MLFSLTIIIISYLIGSIPFGLLIVKWNYGIDVREQGSGNIGATNVLRSVGKKEGTLTLLADALKGFLPVFVVQAATGDMRLTATAGTAAVIGHMFPVFLQFRGGKGVATALGVLIYLMPRATLSAVLVFAAVTFFSRYVSLGSIIAAVIIPISGLIFHAEIYLVYTSSVIALLVIIRHHQNISRLLAGTESKL